MDWAFNYHGPIEAVDDPFCVTCLSKRRAECPTHGKATVPSCAHCHAVAGGECHAHWGAKAALDNHPVSEEAEADWGFAKAVALEEVGKAKRPHVRITMRGDGDLATSGHREIHVLVIAV